MAEKAWSGVFNAETDRRVEKFTESVSYDRRLYAHDIAAQIAHAQMLAKVGIIAEEECCQIEQTLRGIRQEIEQGKFEFSESLEDIHMHIERALIDRLGDVGRRIHAARSRNDLVSTDMRLWVRDAIDQLDRDLCQLQQAFVRRAIADAGVIVPAYTHLRRAQPVLLAHYWLAYCEKLDRDRGRLSDARHRANVSTLGTAALAGTSLPCDRRDVARRLGFDDVAANSLDASSDRDFVVEFAFAMSLVAAHLSGWAEEWILWSTPEFGYLRLPEAFCTGSSIMPQKINPDTLELIRGKSARVIGNLQRLLVLIKGLPLAYNRDLQEDKEPLFDSYDTVHQSLAIAAPLVALTELDAAAITRGLHHGHLDATTLMEYLIARGIPQRTAHHASARAVRLAMDRGVELSELKLEDFRQFDPHIDDSVYGILGAERAVAAFASEGSTAPDEVRRRIETWKDKLQLK